MKKLLLLCCAFGLAAYTYGQDFSGKATYSSASTMTVSFEKPEASDSTNSEKKIAMPMAQQEALNKKIRESMQKEYELVFNKKASLYKEIPKLKGINDEQGLEVVGLGGGTEGGLYKDVRDQAYAENRDVFGKLFLVQDSLENWNWTLGKESKKIGNYTCYKATATKETKHQKTVMEAGEQKEIEVNNTIQITAWYTPEIPISQGPAEYWGLPGFILEVNDGRLRLLCSKIVLNDAGEDLAPPSKGKKVDRATFKKIYDEKVQEMVKMYNNKREKEKI